MNTLLLLKSKGGVILYLERVKAKGNYYLYLKKYDTSIKYGVKKTTLHSFGRSEDALLLFFSWKEDFNLFPAKLLEIGCTRDDLHSWIAYLLTRMQGFEPMSSPSLEII